MQQILKDRGALSHMRRIFCLIATIFPHVVVSYPLLILKNQVNIRDDHVLPQIPLTHIHRRARG